MDKIIIYQTKDNQAQAEVRLKRGIVLLILKTNFGSF
jgi:hypothetical protein